MVKIQNLWSKIKFKLYLIAANYKSKNVLTDFDINWFYGKRVAVVGGANSVLEEKLGAYIDGFDVVVRINKGVEIIESQHEYVGKKTDVLFHSFYEIDSHLGGSPITPQLWKKHDVKRLLFALNYKYSWYNFNNFFTFLNNTNAKVEFSQLPKDLYLKNMAAVQPYSPTVGFSAVNTIFNCQPKELYITGITFFKTPHNAAYRSMSEETLKQALVINKDHDADLEYQHVKNLYLQRPDIVRPDSTLEKIFKTN